MVMAAGLGTRLRPFTEVMPKPLLPLMGVPMAQFAFDSLTGAGVKNIVANVHAHAELATKLLRGLDLRGARLSLSDESRELLGSGGGVRTALRSLGDRPFFLLNADTICSVDLEGLAFTHARLRRERGVHLTLTLFRQGPAGGKYRELFFDDQTGLITALGEPQLSRPFFVGVAVIEPEAIAHLPEGKPFEFVPEILKPAIEAGRAGFHLADGHWYDVGSPSLWFDAHVKVMQASEAGTLPGRWEARIMEYAERIGPMVWAGREIAQLAKDMRSRLRGPVYLEVEEAEARRLLEGAGVGPSAVLYGPPNASARDVISWRELSTTLTPG